MDSINLYSDLAQSALPSSFAGGAAPLMLNQRGYNLERGYKFRALQVLPARLWFNASAEVSQRLDTNVYMTRYQTKSDYVVRILPNITVGYDLTRKTAVYANYFACKDNYVGYQALNIPATQSYSLGMRRHLTSRTDLQIDAQVRNLTQTNSVQQRAFIPGATVSHALSNSSMVFGSAMLQLGTGSYGGVVANETDPFYTLGYAYRYGLWNFIVSNTLIDDFRRWRTDTNLPARSTTMIADIEVNHPLRKQSSAVLGFVRVEQVWNSGAQSIPGMGGSDFRLYTGVRVNVAKPSYLAAMDNLQKNAATARAVTRSAQTRPASCTELTSYASEHSQEQELGVVADRASPVSTPWQ